MRRRKRAKLSDEAPIKSPDISSKLNAEATLPLGSPPDEFTAHIRDELARVGKVIKTAGITLE